MGKSLAALLSGLLVLSTFSCVEKERITVLFTGDERGFTVPAG